MITGKYYEKNDGYKYVLNTLKEQFGEGITMSIVEKAVSQGKKTKRGYTHPLSGFLYCADCGGKMKLNYIKRNGVLEYSFNCGNHMRLGKAYCFSHYIAAKVLEEIIITDIRDKARLVAFDEEDVRRRIAERSAELTEKINKKFKNCVFKRRKRTCGFHFAGSFFYKAIPIHSNGYSFTSADSEVKKE